MPRELSPLEYANLKGLSISWVYMLIKQKKLVARREDGKWWIPISEDETSSTGGNDRERSK